MTGAGPATITTPVFTVGGGPVGMTLAMSLGRDLYERDLALVRPDLHVAWRGNRLPEDCDSLIARITGF